MAKTAGLAGKISKSVSEPGSNGADCCSLISGLSQENSPTIPKLERLTSCAEGGRQKGPRAGRPCHGCDINFMRRRRQADRSRHIAVWEIAHLLHRPIPHETAR